MSLLQQPACLVLGVLMLGVVSHATELVQARVTLHSSAGSDSAASGSWNVSEAIFVEQLPYFHADSPSVPSPKVVASEERETEGDRSPAGPSADEKDSDSKAEAMAGSDSATNSSWSVPDAVLAEQLPRFFADAPTAQPQPVSFEEEVGSEGELINPKDFNAKAEVIVRNITFFLETVDRSNVSARSRKTLIDTTMMEFLSESARLMTATSKAANAKFRGYMRRLPIPLASAFRAWMPKLEYAYEQVGLRMRNTATRVAQTCCNCQYARIALRNVTWVEETMRDLELNLRYGTVKDFIPRVKIAMGNLLPHDEAKRVVDICVRMGDSSVAIATSVRQGMQLVNQTFSSFVTDKMNCPATG